MNKFLLGSQNCLLLRRDKFRGSSGHSQSVSLIVHALYALGHARIVWEGGPAKFAAEMGTGYL